MSKLTVTIPDGTRQNPAARAATGSGSTPQTHHSAPHTTPTSGKAQSAYRIFFSFQSNCGIGRAENMANATAIVCKAVTDLHFLYNRRGCRRQRAPRGLPAPPQRC